MNLKIIYVNKYLDCNWCSSIVDTVLQYNTSATSNIWDYMDTEGDLGINISLPSGTFNSLNQKRSHLLTLLQNNQSDEESDGQSQSDEQNTQIDGDISDEDRVIMPFSRASDGSDSNSGDDSDNDNDSTKSNESEDSDDLDELDNMSLSPPSSLPVLLLDLEKLCGYQPSCKEEVERVTKEIREALLGISSKEDASNSLQEENLQDSTSLDFVARSNELFDAGIAQHFTDVEGDSSENGVPLAIVNYPEFLPLPLLLDDSSTLIPTRILWKKVIHSHSIQVVNRLLCLLSRCSRDLIWKYQMMLEIRRIAKEEKTRKDEKSRNGQLQIWRLETRPAELAKLYDVRETFEVRLYTAKGKHAVFVKEREVRVQRELQRRAESGRGTGGMAGLDWDASVTFGFGDDVDEVVDRLIEDRLNAMREKEDYHAFADNERLRDVGLQEADSDSGSESEESTIGSDFMHGQQRLPQADDSSIGLPLPVSTAEDRVKRRAVTAAKRKRKKGQNNKEKSLAKELRTKIMNAYAEEEKLRHMLISTDEKFALSTVLNLEKQLEKVDELLETLQEDEWKDEEEGLFLDEHESDNDSAGVSDSGDGNPSILNQILAMILGTLPIFSGTPQGDHYSFLKSEHESIITEWKAEFGRLPSLDSTKEEKQQAQRLKSVSNEEGTWGEEPDAEERIIAAKVQNLALHATAPEGFGPTSVLDDWEDGADDLDDFFQDPEVKKLPPTPAPSQSIGLRPGGRINK